MPRHIYTRAYASAYFWGDDLDPLKITQSLLLPPDDQHRRGEPRLIRTRSGKVMHQMTYRAGMWMMSSERLVNSPRLHIHLLWLLDQLEPHRDAIARILARDVSAMFTCFSCGSTTQPPAIPRSVRDRAGALGFTIDVDHVNTSTKTDFG